jgi:hypothetical protein
MSSDHDKSFSLLERDLQELSGPQQHDEVFRTELHLTLKAQAARQPTPRLHGSRWTAGGRRRLAFLAGAVATASLVALVVGYAWLTGSTPLVGPTPASAVTVLRAAAARALLPGEVAHYTYSFTAQVPGGGPTTESGTVDAWIAGGDPTRSAQTVTVAKVPGASGALLARVIQVGGASYGYDATHDALTLPAEQNGAPALVLPNEAYSGASLAQSIEGLTARGSRVVALAPQTLEGVPVNVIQADGVLGRPALRITLYFDAQSDLLRGFDANSIDPFYPAPSWRVRLQSAITMATASTPAGTFSLKIPAGGSHVGLSAEELALPSECGSSKPASAAGSLLATCQANDPGVTAQQLASALSRPSVAELRQGVTDQVLSATDASAAQAQLEAELVRTVTAANPPRPARSRAASLARR